MSDNLDVQQTSSTPAESSGIMSTDELFNKAEEFFNKASAPKEQTPANNAESIPEPKLEKIVGADTSTPDKDNKTNNEDDEDLPLYYYEGKIGNEIKNVEIKDKDQLDRYIQKGLLAEKVYKEYKNLQGVVDTLQEKANAMEAMDKMLDEGKHSEVLDMIVEDMDEEALFSWVESLVENKKKPKEVRDFEREKKEIERYKKEREWEEEQKKIIAEQKAELARKQEKQQLHAWANSEFNRYISKLGDEYRPWLNKQIQLVVASQSKMLDNNNDLTIADLSAALREQLKPVLSRVSPNKMKHELGKLTEVKKQDALTRLQNSTNKTSSAPQKSKLAQAAESGDVGGMFDAFSDMF